MSYHKSKFQPLWGRVVDYVARNDDRVGEDRMNRILAAGRYGPRSYLKGIPGFAAGQPHNRSKRRKVA